MHNAGVSPLQVTCTKLAIFDIILVWIGVQLLLRILAPAVRSSSKMVLSGWATMITVAPYLIEEIPRKQAQEDDKEK